MKQKKGAALKKAASCLVAGMLFAGVFAGCAQGGNSAGGGVADNGYSVNVTPSTQLYKRAIEADEVFHDQADLYFSPLEPSRDDNVTVRLKVRRGNVKKATLQFTMDIDAASVSQAKWNDIPMKFERADETGYYDYFICVIPAQKSAYYYHFYLENEKGGLYYNRADSEQPGEDGANPFETVSQDWIVMPGFSTPDWAKGAMWYSLMPDSFYNADVLNDKYYSYGYEQKPWNVPHTGTLDYYGGDFMGVASQIEYFDSLGVTALSMNPINSAYHQAGYGSYDFKSVDAAFGDNETFRALVDTLHENGMKVCLDGVFTYIPDGSNWYNNAGLYPLAGGINKNDPYYDLYKRDANGNVYLAWGQPALDFSSQHTRDVIYAKEDSVMQYWINEYGIDAWRLDVGPDLSGSQRDNYGEARAIIKDMRAAVKSCNEDFFLMSEGDGGKKYLLTDYVLDSIWNDGVIQASRTFLKTKSSYNSLRLYYNAINNAVMSMPRSIANCSYNYTACHDYARTMRNTLDSNGEEHLSRAMAAELMIMTFVGSPCIFYGDETAMAGIELDGYYRVTEDGAAPNSFSSFDWDKQHWSYSMLDMVKAVGNLRKDAGDLFKTGALMALGLDKDNAVCSFGRFLGDETAVTTLNPADEVRTGVEINVRKMSVRDGTVFTDILTGAQYVTQDGKITVNVMPGGAVFVKDGVADYAGEFTLTGGGVARVGLNEYTAADADVATGRRMAVRECAGNYGIAADVVDGLALTVRSSTEGSAPYYAAEFAGGKAEITVRDARGVTADKITVNGIGAGEQIELVRNGSVCYLKYNGAKVEGSERYVDFDYDYYIGFGGVGAQKVRIENLVLNNYGRTKATSFDYLHSSMTYMTGNEAYYSVSEGKLNLYGAEGNALLSFSGTADFSVKAHVATKPVSANQSVGLISGDKSHVALMRTYRNGKNYLSFGLLTNGKLAAYETVEEEADAGDVVLQLRHGGVYYSAYYSYDGIIFTPLTTKINANYSVIESGVYAQGNVTLVSDYLSYGDAITDGESMNAANDYASFDYRSDAASLARVTKSVSGGEWKYENGGIAQTDAQAEKTVYQLNGTQREFKFNVSLKVNEMAEEGSLGVEFGQAKLLSVSKDGKIYLESEQIAGSKRLLADTQQDANGQSFKFTLVHTNGTLSVYFGQTPACIFSEEFNVGVSNGIRVVGSKCAHFISGDAVFAPSAANWQVMKGELTPIGTGVAITAYPYAFGTNNSVSASDLFLGVNVKFKSLGIGTSKLQFWLGGTTGMDEKRQTGLSLEVEKTGKITLAADGNEVGSYALEKDALASFYLILAVQNKQVEVYVDKYDEEQDENGLATYSQTPVITYADRCVRAGGVSFYARNVQTTLSYLDMQGIRPDQDYKQLRGFTVRKVDVPVGEVTVNNGDAFEKAGSDTISLDFARPATITNLDIYAGMFELDTANHTLIGLGEGNWMTGACLAYGKFDTYELSYKLKLEPDAQGWAGFLVGKNDAHGVHGEGSGILLYLNASGQLHAFAKSGADRDFTCGSAGEPDEQGFYSIRIRVYREGNVKKMAIYGGDALLQTLDLTNDWTQGDHNGFISFASGNSKSYFKDVTITKI